jgi:hypothetical protein
MTRKEREALATRVCNFFNDAAQKNKKTTVNYFKKQGVPRSTIYYILKKYSAHHTTQFLPRIGRPAKLSNKNVKALTKCVNNQTGVSQRRLARRYGVHQATISRTLRIRTPIVIRKRKLAPKMDNDEQEKRARRLCGKLGRLISGDCDVILDDEKYFTFSGSNVGCNQRFYSSDPSAVPSDVKFRKKTKFEPKIMVWMAMSSRGVSSVYVHKGSQAIGQKVYLEECINKRLLPFIRTHHKNNKYIFWPDKASAHYGGLVTARLNEENVPFVAKDDNPPNVPQARPIESIWSMLEQKVFANNWEAKNLELLARRIQEKAKELDKNVLQAMILSVRKTLRKMYDKGLYSVC